MYILFSFQRSETAFLFQIFPGSLLQPNYPDPEDPDNFLGRSEVRRREHYFEQLEDLLPGGIRQVLVQLIKSCLHNAPSRRPTAEQLVTSLEVMKGEVEGAYGELATVDAVRQVRTVKALKAKRNEIERLQEQLEVRLKSCHNNDIHFHSTFLQVVEERHQTELHQKEEEITAAKEVIARLS